MNSIFSDVNRRTNETEGFWHTAEELRSRGLLTTVLYNGTLYYQKPNGTLKSSEFTLTSSHLFKHNNNLMKGMNINWMVFKPVPDPKNQLKKTGFNLSGLHKEKTYTAASDQESLQWVKKLRKVTIASNVEEDYHFIKQIGEGAYCTIYLAQSLHSREKHAVKQISKSNFSGGQTKKDSLVSEIRLMRKLCHPNIVNLHSVYENENYVYLVLDYMEGGDFLARILKKGQFPEKVAAKFMQIMLDVLEHIHSQNIIHRDIKLENILVNEHEWEFKLGDFGLAVQSSGPCQVKCGSPGYIAPEIFTKDSYDSKVDIFSVGIILYILLSGKFPFSGSSQEEVLEANRVCSVTYPEKYWKMISKEGIQFVGRMLNTNPRFRVSASQAKLLPWLSKYLSA